MVVARLLAGLCLFAACVPSGAFTPPGALSAVTMPATHAAVARPAVSGAVRTSLPTIVMAVPKKRQSKMKTRQRKANWFAKARRQATLALSRGKSAKYDPLEDPKYSFDAVEDDDDDEEEDEE